MRLIDADNAKEYLLDAGRADPHQPVEITRLAGGVSNEVLYVGFPADRGRDFVLKQAREQLRVADPWFCSVDRIWREVEVLRICQRLLADLEARCPRVDLTRVAAAYEFARTAHHGQKRPDRL